MQTKLHDKTQQIGNIALPVTNTENAVSPNP